MGLTRVVVFSCLKGAQGHCLPVCVILCLVGSDSEGEREEEGKQSGDQRWVIDGSGRGRQEPAGVCFAVGSGCLTRQRCKRMGKGMDCVWFERAGQ